MNASRLFNCDNSLIIDKGVMILSILLKLDYKFTDCMKLFFHTLGVNILKSTIKIVKGGCRCTCKNPQFLINLKWSGLVLRDTVNG